MSTFERIGSAPLSVLFIVSSKTTTTFRFLSFGFRVSRIVQTARIARSRVSATVRFFPFGQ